MFLEGQIKVSDQEIQDSYRRENTSVNLEYVTFSVDAYLDKVVAPTADEVSKWIGENAASVAAYYLENRDQYVKPAEANTRTILVAVSATDSPSARDEAREKANGLHQAVVAGADFEKLASENPASVENAPGTSEAGKAQWIKQGASADKTLDDAIFALKVGEYSGVVESEDGFRIVKVEEIRPALDRKLDDVRLEIAEKLLVKGRALEQARKDADALLASAAAAAGSSLADVVVASGVNGASELAVAETGMFDQTGGSGEMNPANPFAFQKPWDSIPKIGRSADLSKAAFGLTASSPLADKTFQVKDSWYVVKLKERRDADMTALASAKEALGEKLRSEKVKEMMGDWRTNLFGPAYQRRMFGGEPDHGLLVGKIIDRARHGRKVKINENFFTLPELSGDEGASGSAGDTPSGGVTEDAAN